MEATALTRRPALVRRPRTPEQRIAAAGIGGLLLLSLLVAAGAAAYPTRLVPSARFMFPDWLAGPLAGLGAEMHIAAFGVALGLMVVCYVAVLLQARAVPARWIVGSIVGLHVVFLLAPPLLSTDIFGYLAHARLWSVHGLNPYSHVVAEIPADPVNQYLGRTWPKALAAPYGPLLLMGSPLLAALGFAAAMWALKLAAAVAALGAVALTWKAARVLGRDPRPAAALVGLNPLWLAWSVGGAHNDLPMVLLMTAGVCLAVASRPRLAGAALAGAVAVKATAGIALLALVAGGVRRRRVLVGAVAGAAAAAALSLAVFGADLLGSVGSLLEQGQGSSRQSVPRDISRLLGSEYPLPALRHLGTVIFVLTTVAMLGWAARTRRWIDAAGWITVALLATSTWLHAWYIVALLPLAALSESRRLQVTTVVMTIAMGAIQLTP
ncbi:MAG TPA: glycosyltransferase 87 family protein [Thermoleophilaceae bacterium]|nr:glycosyltransferase 87 family protein [Thermoleophilaceae bacterium]